MMPIRGSGSSTGATELQKTVRDEHRHILALFQLYLTAETDARKPIVDQILDQLASHFKAEEALLYREILSGGEQGRRLVQESLLEHDEVKAMMTELQQAETDDDQALDEFFEDMMRTVRAHFLTEERDMLPLLEALPSEHSE
ncbi:MAG: hemerythrin domain-containing protein [Nitrospira sp.]|nr:hemerythrin domain-containing protein [Nitrospira sp.]